MVVKINMEKAYDCLRWDFLRDTLEDAKLPSKVVQLIMNCVTTPLMQVLWNGWYTKEFCPSRGVRQGDPISPYLFVLTMERLGHVIDKAV